MCVCVQLDARKGKRIVKSNDTTLPILGFNRANCRHNCAYNEQMNTLSHEEYRTVCVFSLRHCGHTASIEIGSGETCTHINIRIILATRFSSSCGSGSIHLCCSTRFLLLLIALTGWLADWLGFVRSFVHISPVSHINVLTTDTAAQC